jgi:hypothetical protein
MGDGANAADPAGATPGQRAAGAADDPGERPRPDGDAPEDRPSERPVREHGGSEDFRAVAPPVMSFAQGRRR